MASLLCLETSYVSSNCVKKFALKKKIRTHFVAVWFRENFSTTEILCSICMDHCKENDRERMTFKKGKGAGG